MFRQFWISPRCKASRRLEPAASPSLGPSKPPRWVRLLPLDLPELFFRVLVLGSERTASSDVPSHGAAAGRFNAGRSAAAEALEEPQPLDRGSAAQIRTYPFGVNLVKETLGFSVLNPPSLGAHGEYAFYFGKRKQLGFSQKYAFTIYRFAIGIVLLIKYSF